MNIYIPEAWTDRFFFFRFRYFAVAVVTRDAGCRMQLKLITETALPKINTHLHIIQTTWIERRNTYTEGCEKVQFKFCIVETKLPMI